MTETINPNPNSQCDSRPSAEFRLGIYDPTTVTISGPELAVAVKQSSNGLLVVLGPEEDPGTPEVFFERRSDRWAIYIHPHESDPVCFVDLYSDRAEVFDPDGKLLHGVQTRFGKPDIQVQVSET